MTSSRKRKTKSTTEKAGRLPKNKNYQANTKEYIECLSLKLYYVKIRKVTNG